MTRYRSAPAFAKQCATRAPALLTPFVLCMAWSQPAFAYIGPGPGLTMIGALIAVVGAVAFAVFGLVLFPIRALMRKKKAAAKQSVPEPAENATTDKTEDSG